ncbi:hypothetical protein ABIA45_002692 [Bradyrhizobium sp. USDA 336]
MTCGGGLRARLVLRDGADAPPQDEANRCQCPLKLLPRTDLILRSPPQAGVSKDGRRENLKCDSPADQGGSIMGSASPADAFDLSIRLGIAGALRANLVVALQRGSGRDRPVDASDIGAACRIAGSPDRRRSPWACATARLSRSGRVGPGRRRRASSRPATGASPRSTAASLSPCGTGGGGRQYGDQHETHSAHRVSLTGFVEVERHRSC